MSNVPEEDHVDRPVVLHGRDVDDEVGCIDPPVGGVDDEGVEGRVAGPHVQQVELDGDHGYVQDEVGKVPLSLYFISQGFWLKLKERNNQDDLIFLSKMHFKS